jgi:hypothetical protein
VTVFGRNRPPAPVRSRLEGDERVLAWGTVGGPAAPRPAETGMSDANSSEANSSEANRSDAVTSDDGAANDGAADAAGERYVVATNVGLWWPEQPPRRIPWHLIVRATWSERGLTVVEADVVDDLLLVERPARTVALAREGKIPPAVRKRVEGSIATTHDVRLDDGPARLVARRITGQDGQVWLARLDPQTPDTERARAQVRALVERFRLEDEARREALLR